MAKPKVKIEYAVVCDDVRREDNGKMFIIGAYGKDARVPSYPANIRLSLLLAIRSEEAQTVPLDVRILQDGRRVIEAKGQIDFAEPDDVAMYALSGFPLSFSDNAELDFEVKLGGGRYKSVYRLPVRRQS